MRDYEKELADRIQYIRDLLKETGRNGIVYYNSGGKDSALVGIICKMACENTVGLIMPCSTRRNYEEDTKDAKLVARKYGIESRKVDITPVKRELVWQLSVKNRIDDDAFLSIAPRLRMTALYAIASTEKFLVCGTTNRSEIYTGYFTKWGDGAFDFNPVSDLTVSEVYEFLEYLDAPKEIMNKRPSRGLYEDQFDEEELGFSYKELDDYLLNENGSEEVIKKIEKRRDATQDKRRIARRYKLVKEELA